MSARGRAGPMGPASRGPRSGPATPAPLLIQGAMTMGASTDATDDAVQAHIVAAGYGH